MVESSNFFLKHVLYRVNDATGRTEILLFILFLGLKIKKLPKDAKSRRFVEF